MQTMFLHLLQLQAEVTRLSLNTL